ncbi:tRNA(m5U54)methyltransferase [Microbotryomycetes sp. JL201]|nr:tRNA(m5U54)methyltransferase [Microbotryomycetes sp. JL201]
MSSAAPKRALSRSTSPANAPLLATQAHNGSATTSDSSSAKRAKLDTDDNLDALESSVKPALPSNELDEGALSTDGHVTAQTGDSAIGSPQPSSTNAATSSNLKPKTDKKAKLFKNQRTKAVKPGGAEEVGAFDVAALLGHDRVEELGNPREWYRKSLEEWGSGAQGKNVTVKVVDLNSHGDGLALLTAQGHDKPTRLLSVPFALPGELVEAHIARHEPDYLMSHGDLINILEASDKRIIKPDEEMSTSRSSSAELDEVRTKFGQRVQCKYFGRCSGCQYQALSYDDQLEIKRNVVRKAFRNFSKLDDSLVPEIGPTLPSPLQYGYRTKLTPHFEVPPANRRRNDKKPRTDGQEDKYREWQVTIGFEEKGRKRILDIEECPIATKVINDKLKTERVRVKENISTYKRGATLLLRDSLPPRDTLDTSFVKKTGAGEPHICITDHHATVRERVGEIEFEQKAGSFFQNNNSILPSLLDYVKQAVKPLSSSDSVDERKRYLVDAYCGSGLFAISLADQFDVIEGVEIDRASVSWAKKNAEFNKGPGRGQIGFREGKAEAIFDDIDFPADQTTILIDPPRKGCDELFLSQLLKFNPAAIIYVSCNVHTQARDIGWLVRESAQRAGSQGFKIESIRAADLFANTHHAEGVAILRRQIV